MTYSKLISILLIAGTYLCPAMAQSVSSGADNDPISMIEAESEGNVEIDIPQNIIDLLLKEQEVKHKRENLRPGINKMPGYRIQVSAMATISRASSPEPALAEVPSWPVSQSIAVRCIPIPAPPTGILVSVISVLPRRLLQLSLN